MKSKRKPLVIALICVAALAAAAVCVWFFWLKDFLSLSGASPVYVNPVSSIVGLDTGVNARYSGIVEPQETYKINKDETKTVAEILVQEGDEVHVGDVLFRYDTQEIQWSLDQAEIDQERIASQLTTLRSQLAELNADKKKASNDEQAAFTLQIQAKELEIKTQEYDSAQKRSEIDKLRESLNNADVLSEVEGIVREINSGSQQDGYDQQKPFISILSSGEYRVKGTISELNFASLSVGQAVIVHSRVDPSQTWRGVVDSIDQETAADQNNGMTYYYGMDSGERSSKYNFYVVLENPLDLILGQHVYIEPDLGTGGKKEGLWLPAMYIAHDDGGSFVWARNDSEKLEKRDILLGEYDKDNDTYEIKSGVTSADFIAYPSDSLKPGLPTTTDASLQGNYMDGPEGPDGNAGDGMGSAMDEPVLPEGDQGDYTGGAAMPEDGIYTDEYPTEPDGGSLPYGEGNASDGEVY